MKLKSQPEDFIVEELTDVLPESGPYALYRLEKQSLGTPEAAQAIVGQWNLARDAVRHGGLKDRHASTTQYVTIQRGPRQDLQDRSFKLTYLGQMHRHYTAKDIRANRFAITLRSLTGEAAQIAQSRLSTLASGGIVNYFDDQRFGSLGVSGTYIAHPWCKGDYERALYLAIAEPNIHDRPREKEQKAILREFWGKWLECKDRLDRSHRRSIVTYLCDHPTDFKRAIALMRPDLRSIYLSAFQSYLWNRWLSGIIEAKIEAEQRVTIESDCGPLWVPSLQPTSEASDLGWLHRLSLPLPAARQHDWPEDLFPYLERIMDSLEMKVNEIRLKYPRDTFFSRGLRNAWLTVGDLEYDFQDDDQSDGRKKLQLRFTLPRGAYATMIVKYVSTI
jgi:tRNA pseudouridine13 synthase